VSRQVLCRYVKPPAHPDYPPPYQRNPELRFFDEYVGRYDGEIASADAQIGRVLDALRARGWYDAATIALVADHGESMGDGEGWFEHGNTVDDAEAHVPLIIKFPRQAGGAPPPGIVVDTPVSTVDLFPTLIAAAGLIPPVIPANDLRAVAAGAARPAPAPITELPRFDEQGIAALIVKAHGPTCSVLWNLTGAALQPGGEPRCRAPLAHGVAPLLRDTIDFRLDGAVSDRRDMSIPGRRDAFVSQRGGVVPLAEHEREALRKLGYMD
jgi:hypothetical protein